MSNPSECGKHHFGRRRAMAGMAGSVLLPWLPAHAQTVAALKSAGVLRAGVQVSQAPWGFMDSAGRNEGFEIDLLRGFCAEVGVTPEFTAVTTSTRIPALLASKIDVIAAVMGIYPDRQKVVLFSRPYCNLDTVFIGKVGQSVKGWTDLKGLVVGVPRGTPQDAAVSKAAPSEATVRRFEDDANTLQALISGQADIIGAAATQVVNLERAAGAGKFEQKFVLSRQFNAFAVRQGQTELVAALNDFLARKVHGGELKSLYQKWTGTGMAELPTTGAEALPIIMAPY